MVTEEQIIEDLQKDIQELRSQVRELEVKKSGLVSEINAEFFKAKTQCDTELAEARNNSTHITQVSQKLRADADMYSARIRGEVDSMLRLAKDELKVIEDNKVKLSGEKTDYDSYRLSVQRALLDKKLESERLMNEAINLTKRVNEEKYNLDSRQATLVRKEEDLSIFQANLESKESTLKHESDRLSKLEAELKKEFENIAIETKKNRELVESIKIESESIKKSTEYNKQRGDTIEKQLSELTIKELEVKNKFDRLDIENAKLEEKIKSFNDEKALLDIEKRKVDKSIATLKRLREEK